MTIRHKTGRVVLPGNSAEPKLVLRFNVESLSSLMIQVSGGDAVVLGEDRIFEEGYNVQMGYQRVYSAADFVGMTGSFEFWMCAAGSSDVTVSLEYSFKEVN